VARISWKGFPTLVELALASVFVFFSSGHLVLAQPDIDPVRMSCDDQCLGRYYFCVEDANAYTKLCSDQWKSCDAYCKAGGSGPYRVIEGEGDCLPGETRNELGICAVSFRHKEAKQPNCEPGPNDDCRIRVTVAMLPKLDRTFVICTGMLMPMPGGEGCNPAVPSSGELEPDGCPKGMVKGADDRCVPAIRPGSAGRYDRFAAEIGEGLTSEKQLQSLHELGKEAGIWFWTTESEETVRRTEEALGDHWQRDRSRAPQKR